MPLRGGADSPEVDESIAAITAELRRLGVRGSLGGTGSKPKARRKRSTRRRQDAPNLPRRKINPGTVGRCPLVLPKSLIEGEDEHDTRRSA